uniref:Uncharacterized protein n=1 Tax=Timema monikensis TaxID=170555 RepID=A0A7R9HTX1_9NEOP|nr:unnamed protein product [Timema monikensis]
MYGSQPETALREQQCSLCLRVPPSSPAPSYVRMRITVKHHVAGTVKRTVPYKDQRCPTNNTSSKCSPRYCHTSTGRTLAGKSRLANTIFKRHLRNVVNHSPISLIKHDASISKQSYATIIAYTISYIRTSSRIRGIDVRPITSVLNSNRAIKVYEASRAYIQMTLRCESNLKKESSDAHESRINRGAAKDSLPSYSTPSEIVKLNSSDEQVNYTDTVNVQPIEPIQCIMTIEDMQLISSLYDHSTLCETSAFSPQYDGLRWCAVQCAVCVSQSVESLSSLEN